MPDPIVPEFDDAEPASEATAGLFGSRAADVVRSCGCGGRPAAGATAR